MKRDLADTLCTRCGLCCDGSLFADVELASRNEASTLEVLGLEIEDADNGEVGLLLQPCRALKGRRCGIYPHRPDCCRTFECRLFQEVRRGVVGIDRASETIAEVLLRIEHVKELTALLGSDNADHFLKERAEEALTLSEGVVADPGLNRTRKELEAAMSAVEDLIQKTFLSG